ncbi:MAG: hypothetical protein QM791_22775 [Ferruginibacter sp.]
MKPSKFFNSFIIFLVLSFSIPVSVSAFTGKTNVPVAVSDSAEDARKLSALTLRLSEIQSMDISTLTPAERKDLKQELREMKATADGLNQRVYLSVGAIIIIILLLILIL